MESNVSNSPIFQTAQLSSADFSVISQLVDHIANPSPTVLEVGSWIGTGSTMAIGQKVKQRGGQLVCVDSWGGSPGVKQHSDYIAQANPLVAFLDNVGRAGLADIVLPFRADSRVAPRFLADRSFDMIFIDANHQYSFVSEELRLYRPKLRQGGIFSGHDCEARYAVLPPETRAAIDANLETDYLPDYRLHPGVVKAISELTDNVTLAAEQVAGCCVWAFRLG